MGLKEEKSVLVEVTDVLPFQWGRLDKHSAIVLLCDTEKPKRQGPYYTTASAAPVPCDPFSPIEIQIDLPNIPLESVRINNL